MRTSIRFVTPTFIALLGCGSVTVTPPGTTTGNSGGATTTSSSTAGGGGSGGSCTGTCGTTTTNSGGATTTSGSGTAGGGGAGGSCTGTCGTCVAAGAWSMAVTDAVGSASPALMQNTMPDGGTMLVTTVSQQPSSTMTRIDPAGGVVWTRSLDALVWAVAPDAACGVFIAGTIPDGQTDLLGTSYACSAVTCAVVGRLDADGNPIWIRVYDPGLTKSAAPLHLAVTADRVVVRGIYEGTLDFGAGPMTGIPGIDSNQFIATLSSDGQGLWSRTISSPSPNDVSGGIAVTPDGDVAVNGGFVTTIDFGEGPIGNPAQGVDTMAFIAAYDPSGALRLSKIFDVAGSGSWAVSRGSAGEIVVAGHGYGTLDMGGGLVGSPGQTSLIVAKLDQDGNHLWSTAYPEPACFTGLAVDQQGHVWAGSDGVVMELDGAGATLAAHAIGGSGKRCVESIGVRPDGRPIVMGTFKDVVDLGSGILATSGHQGAFAGTLGP